MAHSRARRPWSGRARVRRHLLHGGRTVPAGVPGAAPPRAGPPQAAGRGRAGARHRAVGDRRHRLLRRAALPHRSERAEFAEHDQHHGPTGRLRDGSPESPRRHAVSSAVVQRSSSVRRSSRRLWLWPAALAMLPVLAGCGGGASAVASGAQSGAIAYVTTGAFEALLGTSITPVELTDNRALSPITVGSLPSALAATSDGRRLLVTLQGENHLVVLDTAGDSVLGTVTTGLQPDAVAVGGPNDD